MVNFIRFKIYKINLITMKTIFIIKVMDHNITAAKFSN